MRPVNINITSAAPTAPVVLDYIASPFSVGLALNFTSGTGSGTVTVQYSFDDPYAAYATDYGTNANWINLASMTAKAADADGNLTSPVRAVRANCTVYNSGVIKFTAIQSSES